MRSFACCNCCLQLLGVPTKAHATPTLAPIIKMCTQRPQPLETRPAHLVGLGMQKCNIVEVENMQKTCSATCWALLCWVYRTRTFLCFEWSEQACLVAGPRRSSVASEVYHVGR